MQVHANFRCIVKMLGLSFIHYSNKLTECILISFHFQSGIYFSCCIQCSCVDHGFLFFGGEGGGGCFQGVVFQGLLSVIFSCDFNKFQILWGGFWTLRFPLRQICTYALAGFQVVNIDNIKQLWYFFCKIGFYVLVQHVKKYPQNLTSIIVLMK